jgi:Skp family chaperone for outer membrane proteins
MAKFETVEAAEARIAELESENKRINKDLQKSQKDHKSIKDFLDSKGIDAESDLDNQWESVVGKSKSDADSMIKKIEKLEKNYANLLAEKEQIAAEASNNLIRSEYKSRFADIIGGDDAIELMIAKKQAKVVDGKVFYSDPERGEISIDDHVTNFKKKFPERVRNQQYNGSGSNGNPQKPDDGKVKMKMEEFSKLTDAAKNDFFNKGGEIE